MEENLSTTPKLSKQLIFNIDKVNETRAFTATKAQTNKHNQQTSMTVNTVNQRPTTHDGKLMPTTPKSGRNKDRIGLSPRQISFKLVSDEIETNEIKDNKNKESIEKSSSIEFTTNPIDFGFYNDSEVILRPSTTNNHSSLKDTLTNMQILPTFIKSRSSKTSSTKSKIQPNGVPMIFSSAYPSLSHRLNASILTNNNTNPAAQSIDNIQTNNNSRKDRTIKMDPFEDNNQSMHYFRTDDANQSTSSASTIFQDMDIDDIISYLLESKNKNSTNAPFVHVASRFNVEYVHKRNFYDLVVLDRPGNPKSGLVWTPSHYKSDHMKLLPAHTIMQLSLYGLLSFSGLPQKHDSIPQQVQHTLAHIPGGGFDSDEMNLNTDTTNDNNTIGELISIPQFILEKNQLEYLRTGRFFGCFKEVKAFNAWRNYARHHAIIRAKQGLLKESYFAEEELVSCMLEISNTIYLIEHTIHLFHYHGNGIICFSDFIQQQIKKNILNKQKLVDIVHELMNKIEFHYNSFMNSDKLAKKQQDVRDHHPLKDLLKEDHNVKFRSILLIEDEFKRKLKRICLVAQFNIDLVIAKLIKNFWCHFKQFILGIKQVSRNAYYNEDHYWNLDHKLINISDGSINPHTLNYMNSLEDILNDKSLSKDVFEDVVYMNSKNDNSDKRMNINDIIEHTNTLHRDITIKDNYQLNNKMGIRVSKGWEDHGSHLSINIYLLKEKSVLGIHDFITLKSMENLKVITQPTKSETSGMMFALCSDLIHLIESIPSIKKHHLIFVDYIPDYQSIPIYEDPDLSVIDNMTNNFTNNAYFTFMTMHSIFSSTGCYELAVETLRMVNQAFLQATTIDSYVFRLYEIIRSLWSLNPNLLSKRIERSFVLPKILNYIENPDAVDDLKRSQKRDEGQLHAFILGTECLQNTLTSIQKFYNLKHKLGFITSFRPIVEQLLIYRSIQNYSLYVKLPTSFNNRCSLFYHFIRKLTEFYDRLSELTISNQVISDIKDGIIQGLYRLRNFDSIRLVFDSEQDSCESIYKLIEEYKIQTYSSNELNAIDLKVKNLLSNKTSKNNSTAPTLTSEKLYNVFIEAINNLLSSSNKARTSIMSCINNLKGETLRTKSILIKKILRETKELELYDWTSTDKSSSEISYYLLKKKTDVENIQSDVDKNVSAQFVLLEAHEIIGAATPILELSEVDRLLIMEQLDITYQTRYKAWNCILDMNHIEKQLKTAKVYKSDIAKWSKDFFLIIKTFDNLKQTITDQNLLNNIYKYLENLAPKVEIASYLSTPSLKPRHWKQFSDEIFVLSGLNIKFLGKNNENMYLQDITKKEPLSLGNIKNVILNEFFDRNIEKYLQMIRYTTSEAVIELSMENTLDSVEKCLKSLIVKMSGEWLRDSTVREKVLIDLNEVTNINELNVIIKYCIKSVLMVENSAQDMNTIAFDHRIDKLKIQLYKLDKFITNLDVAQQEWIYLMPFLKFSGRGEIDRDAIHMFNKCTEDLKRIESALQQRAESLVQAVANSTDNDLNTENLKSNLSTILDSSHSSIQSLLDACPRLSLISYNRLVSLVELWLFGPHTKISFVSDCFQDMFEHVGELIISIDIVTRSYHCLGFHSNDNIETIMFENSINFYLTLDEFVKKFNYELRFALESSCDQLILNRIKCLQSLLTDSSAIKIIDNITNVFQIRVSKLFISFHDKIPNEAFYLINSVSFAEDIWTALGHPTGCIVMARNDLAIENLLFSNHWRISLNEMLNESKRTILTLQDIVLEMKSFPKIKLDKSKALLSSLLLQEISFLRVIEILLNCKCLESATELWAGRYQLRFQYNQSERHLQSPIDISLGSINIPYGLEYGGSKIRFLCDLNIENVLQKTIGSALSLRGSLFINHEDSQKINGKYEIPGESSISIKDLAAALGRISTTITNLNHPQAVNFYLSRILYLDAIGSVDFTNITSHSLQVLINGMNLFWNAIENKNDQFIQDSLKFPLKTKFSRSEIQTERRKNNLHDLRKNISYMKKTNRFIGLVIIGMASESFYSDISVFDEFYRNIFNAISLVWNQPINNLGLYLTTLGFRYGMDIQATLKSSINELKDSSHLKLMQSLCTTVVMKELASLSIKTLKIYNLSNVQLPTDNAARFKIEMLCFCCTLWECIVAHRNNETKSMHSHEQQQNNNHNSQIDLQSLRNELFLLFYKKLELIATPEEIIRFDEMIGPNELMIHKEVTNEINKTISRDGLINSSELIHTCALFWGMISNSNNAVVIIHGEAGIGKTCIRNTVINTIKTIGLKSDCFLSKSWPSRCRRSAEIILDSMKKWIKQLKLNRLELEKKQKQLENERLLELAHVHNDENGEDPLADIGNLQKEKLKSIKINSKKFLKSYIQSDDKYLIHTSVIHHASLSANTLLGHFDSKGHWLDGILIRKIRHIDVHMKANNIQSKAFHIIVLNGPIGYLVEQIFSSPFYLAPSLISLNTLPASRNLLFPNSEYHKLSENVKIVIETNNIRHASPGCFTYIPMLNVPSASGDVCIKNLITTWIRSIYHWLGNFSPWLDFLEFLQNLLLNRKFISDLIYLVYFASDIKTVEVIAKISAFLRYLEDLLKQIHVLVLKDASFSIPEDQIDEDDDEDSDSDDSESENNENNQKTMEECLDAKIGAMSLNLKNRELLMKRGYVSIIYSAIWGFGGIYNCNDKRKFFDNALRDSIMLYFTDIDISISSDCSVFECVLDLHNGELTQAVQIDQKISQILMNPFIPKKFEAEHVYAELAMENGKNSLVFHTPSTRAFKVALEHLLSTGGNVLVLGSKSCGKTFIINHMLQDLSKNIVSPLKLREQINENLVDIVNGVRKTEGIFAALDIMQQIVNQFALSASKNDSQIDFTTLWQSTGKQLKSLWRESAKKNFENKNISSSITSIRSTSTASDLRYWLEREFTTEVPSVLETSRFSYGLVFVDDLHLSISTDDQDSDNNVRLIENRTESLLKGLMEGTPLFNIQRNITVRNPNKLGFHDGTPMSNYLYESYELPILHREFCSDPRFPALKDLDNYVLQRTGVLCSATGQYNDFLKSIYFSQMLPHLSGIGLPTMNSTELHVSLIAGAFVSLNSGTLDRSLIDILKNEIVELSRFTINACNQIINAIDLNLTTSLEQILRSLVIIDVSLVSRFCISLQYGCNHVTNPGGLLQLYCHEWKRYFLDPLPNGTQRDRIVHFLTEQLDSLDCNQWSISIDWMKALQDDFATHKDRVWTDSRIFQNISNEKNIILSDDLMSKSDEINAPITSFISPLLKQYNIVSNDEIQNNNDKISSNTDGIYLPVELDYQRTELNSYNGTWNPNTNLFNDIKEPEVLVGKIDKVLNFQNYIGLDIRTVLYPAAISLMLRMIRILSVSGKHLLLTGYFGSTRITALYLAAKICNLEVIQYDVKHAPGVTEAIPSDNTRYSMDFTRFMKDAIYKIAGFKINYEMMQAHALAVLSSSSNQSNTVIYDVIPTERILLVISSCQQLSDLDRKLLLSIIDYQDASYIFDDQEILGMMEALQKYRASHKTTQNNIHIDFESIESNLENSQETINPNPVISNSTNTSILPKQPSVFTSYAFHWIKTHIKDAILRNLTIAIDIDISRLIKLDTNKTSVDATVIIKKMTAATSNNYHNSKKQTTSTTITLEENNLDKNPKKQRYSLLSKRNPTNKMKITNNSASTKSYNPQSSIPITNHTDDKQSSYQIESKHELHNKIERNSIFTCPLLGPMISRRFYTLWYDIESYDAARGICSILMKNEKYYLHSLTNTLKSELNLSPTILSLRTSSIGTYILKNEISLDSDDNNNGEKKISKEEQQAKYEEEERRKKKFKSTVILDRFNLVLDHRIFDFKTTTGFLGVLDNIGVFKSFSSDLQLDEVQEDMINKYVSSFIEEARAILPHVLSVPTSSDALFLSEPIITKGSEVIAQTASNLVMYFITELSPCLIRRKLVLETVQEALSESMYELEQTKQLEDQLLNSNSNLQVAMRKVTKEAEILRKQTDGFSNTFECSIEYETQRMLQEDIHSMHFNAKHIDDFIKLKLKDIRNKISSHQAYEWTDFSSHYTKKNLNKQYIEVMRGIMILIKQTVKVSTKSDKSKAAKTEEDNIAKFASTLLIKFNDFINLIFNTIANPLNSNQLQLLHQVNLNLNSTSDLDLDITNSAYKVMKVIEEVTMDTVLLSKDSVFESLKIFLIIIELKVITQQTSDNLLNQIKISSPILSKIQESNNIMKNEKSNNLKSNLDFLLNKMHSIDAILIKNRKKLEAIESCTNNRDHLFQGIEESKGFVDIELNQIKDILQTFISDISISVAVLLRSGWLPEQIRQESMEQMRQSLIKNNVITSDNPFLMGKLIDRRQVYQWTNFDFNNLPRDPASINSMYLLQLVPYYSLVIDPDGSAVSILTSNYLENYKTYHVAALKFTLPLLESWIQNITKGSYIGISLIITDLQAGASEDLICFLSSDICSYNTEDSISNCGLEFIVNPYDLNNSDSTSTNKSLKIPSKFRLSMITSKCFSIDESGTSYPLPLTCMKHVTIVHWTSSSNKSYYVHAQPGDNIRNTQYISDQTLSQKMGSMLCKQLSYHHFQKITTTNEKITLSTESLYHLEDSLVNLMYQCACEEKIASIIYSTEIIVDEEAVQHEFIPMLLLTNETITKKIIENITFRKTHSTDIDRNKTILRDLMAYVQVITEVFSMSIDFIKTCSSFLPNEILTPYALSSNAICNSFLKSALVLADKKLFLKGLPRSLKEMKSISKGFSDLQNNFRLHKQKSNSVKNTKHNINQQNNLKSYHQVITHHSNSDSPPSNHIGASSSSSNSNFDRRRSSIKSANLDWNDKNYGMVQSSRDKVMNELSIILIPLKTFFLRELVHYIQLSIKPGLEWLAKLLLLLTTWSQSDPNIPIEEIRALIYFVMESTGQELSRYAYSIQNYSNKTQNNTEYNENSSNEIVKLAIGRPSILRNTNIQHQNMIKSIDSSKDSEGEGVDKYSNFLSELPNVGTMKNRVTAYRINQNKDFKTSIQSISSNNPVVDWVDRGYGLIDGLMINSKSSKWLIQQNFKNEIKSSCSKQLLRKQYIMLDTNMIIINKTKNMICKLRSDSFEYEWFKVKGIRNFVMNLNNDMGISFGGDNIKQSSMFNNIKSKQTQLQVPLKMPKSHSMISPNRKASTKLPLVSEFSKLDLNEVDDENESNKSIMTTKNRRLSLVNLDDNDDNIVINPHKRSLKAAESNTIAHTSKVGRISKALSNVTTSLGRHRSTLISNQSVSSPRTSAMITPGKISVISNTNISRENTIAELSQRRITLAQSKRQTSLISGTSTKPTSKPIIGTSGIQNRFNHDGELIEDISDLITTPSAYKNILMLETHPQLAKIFKGMSCGIVRNISDFADWKSALSALKTVDPIKLSEEDLKLLLFTIKPPNFEDFEDEMDKGSDVGLWLKGYELSLIQSLLLGEALMPGSSCSLVEVIFALQAIYLQKNGHIVQHADETIPQSSQQNDSDDDDNQDDDDEEEDVEEDNFDVDAILPSRHSTEIKNQSDNRSSFFRSLDKFSDYSFTYSQENIHFINSWKKLEKVLKGTSNYRGAQCLHTKNTSILSCRDFENWESVLLDVLLEDLGIEKYVFTKELRDSTMGLKSSIFLTNHSNSIQMSILSQRARDIAIHRYDHISIINCKENYKAIDVDNDSSLRLRCITDGNIYRNQRHTLVDLIKNIKNAVNHQRIKRAIVENLDFQTIYGNSIINSVLIPAVHFAHSNTSTTNTTSMSNPGKMISSNALAPPLSQAQQHFANLENKKKSVLLKVIDITKTGIIEAKSEIYGKSWHSYFPLIISAEWGSNNISGIGPLITLAEMNYVWLPRFTPADVLYSNLSSKDIQFNSTNPMKSNTSNNSSCIPISNLYSKHTVISPSIAESCGLLYEELESSLLWVLNCSKCLNKSRITDEIRTRLRNATPVEIRLTACIVTIWQLVQYLRCSKRELQDIPAVWSACLNPISLWQFTRLMLKVCDILESDWNGNMTLKERLQDERFSKAMWIIAESFSDNDCNIYSAGNNSNKGQKVGEIKEKVIITNPNISNKNKNTSNNTFGLSQSNQSYISQLKQNISTNKSSSKVEQISINDKNVINKDKSYLSPRAKKQLRRKLRLENEARLNYLEELSSTDKFSINFDKNTNLNTSNMKDIQSNINIEKEFLDQFLSCIGHYMSAAIDELQRNKNINETTLAFEPLNTMEILYNSNNKEEDKLINNKKVAFEGFSNIVLAAVEARRMSNKTNIPTFPIKHSKLTQMNLNDSSSNVFNEFEIWPDITDTMDLLFGTMNSNDIITSMITWTFHGHTNKHKNVEGKVIQRANIIKSIKKLSLLIKEGKVDLYQSNVKY